MEKRDKIAAQHMKAFEEKWNREHPSNQIPPAEPTKP
jgi:hypothetical protein